MVQHISEWNAKAEKAAVSSSGDLRNMFRCENYSVISAEVKFTDFLVEHNIPLVASDHACALFRAMFHGSLILK